MNNNSKFNNLGFKKWLKIIASGDLLTKLRKSENGGLKSNANSGEEGHNKKTLSSEKASRISSFCRPKSTVTRQMRCAAARVLPWLQRSVLKIPYFEINRAYSLIRLPRRTADHTSKQPHFHARKQFRI